jgi:DNA-binding CsgD family transcriptional regulator
MEIRLTEKEVTLIKLKAMDLTNEEIARVMTTNRDYVNTWLHTLYQKIGVKKSAGMIYWACKNGVLELNCKNLPTEDKKVG